MHLAFARRTLLFLAAATISAVFSDWLIEAAAALGVYGHGYVDHDQRSVICTLTAGAILFFSAALMTLLEKLSLGRRAGPIGDWLAEAAHDISTRWSWRALPQSFAIALVVRYAMESARVIQLNGHAASGFSWLGGPPLFALCVHALFCVVAFFGLIALMRGFDRTLQRLVRLVVAIVVSVQLYLDPTTHFVERGISDFQPYLSILARLLGDRAPPIGVSVTL